MGAVQRSNGYPSQSLLLQHKSGQMVALCDALSRVMENEDASTLFGAAGKATPPPDGWQMKLINFKEREN